MPSFRSLLFPSVTAMPKNRGMVFHLTFPFFFFDLEVFGVFYCDNDTRQ